MKSNLLISTLFLAGGCAVNAATIANDPFAVGGAPDYIAGNALTGQGPANTGDFAGVYINDTNAVVSDTGLTFSDPNYFPASGGSVNIASDAGNGRQGRLLTSPISAASTNTVYLSFLLQTGTDNPASYRAFELHDGGFADGPNRMFQLGFQDGDFDSDGTNFGFRVGGVSTQLGLNDGLANLFVVEFDLSDTAAGDSVTVFQNPDLSTGLAPATGETVGGLDITFDRTTFARFGGSDGISFDELRIGETFADVTVVPEPSSVLLVGLAGIGALVRRRR